MLNSQRQVRIRGQMEDMYYVEYFDTETLADLRDLVCKKYQLESSKTAFKLNYNHLDYSLKIADLNLLPGEFLQISVPIKDMTKTVPVRLNNITPGQPTNENQELTKNSPNDQLDASNQKTIEPKKLNALIDKIQSLGISSKQKIKSALEKYDYDKMLAAVSLIEQEQGTKIISDFQKRDQTRIKKLMSETKMPVSIASFVYFGNSKDKDRAQEAIEEFES